EYGAADVSLGERIEEFSDDELSVEEIDVEHFPKEEMPVDEIEELQVKLTALLETQREKREAGFSKGRGMWSPPIESIVKERGEIVEIASGAFVTEANKISLASDLDIEEVVHENSQLSEAISNSDPDAEIEFGSGYENL
ncbi:MAG: hypothetical protein KDD25_08565, partial [Bdellovibrionales bacterium]|nr:hypothetical protein [Bdellovibrionales bacterium]